MSEIPTPRDWHDALDYFNLADVFEPGEGLLAAFVPVTDKVPKEYEYRDGTRNFRLFSWNGVALDMLPGDAGACKWWMVKDAAREAKVGLIEPVWAGPADDFTLKCLPDLPQPPNTHLAVRRFSRGPWIKLPLTVGDDE